jgi:hypothetical protein
METRIVAEAESELSEAIQYYEEIEPGLGLRLKDEARAAVTWIESHPTVPRLRSSGYRRVNLKIFRYFIAYRAQRRHLDSCDRPRPPPSRLLDRSEKANSVSQLLSLPAPACSPKSPAFCRTAERIP